MTGIEYPTFFVEGHGELSVRPSNAAQILMGRRGLPMKEIAQLTDPKNPDCVENWFKIFTCFVDENFSGSDPNSYKLGNGPTSDYWASKIGPERFSDMTRACNEALGKVAEALSARVGPLKIAS